MWANREAAKINLALKKVGYSGAKVTEWWNHASYEELGGKTPTQAWNSEEYDLVRALVERFVSEKFASQLAKNPSVLKRLADLNRS